MPSPIAHGLAGLTVHLLSAHEGEELRNPIRAALLVGTAMAADVDLLFRLVDGRNHHGGVSHSLGAALAVSLVAAAGASLMRLARPLAVGWSAGLAWVTHLVLDYLSRDTQPPIGLMALWPFDAGYYKFPWPLFLDVGRSLGWATVRHNLMAVGWELVVLFPAVILVGIHRRRSLPARGE